MALIHGRIADDDYFSLYVLRIPLRQKRQARNENILMKEDQHEFPSQ
jgi:hypothetical protein